jgi:inorganic pyrophosphatase
MNTKVKVFIEIEKDSNMKYEINKETGKLDLDRILPYPYYYPYSYGYITDTLAMDNDELDALIITDKKIEKDKFYDVYIIGILDMSDEKGKDEKVLCVLDEDYRTIKDMEDLSIDIRENIHWFFSNYKSKTPNKWSKVEGFRDKEYAVTIYKRSCFLYNTECLKNKYLL